ncbi:hypothetical protein L211DRAFT_881604 [Terfezia boudieri ATCC MYA-4762]|uniref:Uncharacterized protein n=1 Tax=Terfezia boudieri ATCC MYA-4762 TaxID=1051890 RepID=A0A3N4M1H8_9PEZI|nr:hypothetical protein L211DRAFT_881604 [Terfezia boudieri ATCC MYA-4762]
MSVSVGCVALLIPADTLVSADCLARSLDAFMGSCSLVAHHADIMSASSLPIPMTSNTRHSGIKMGADPEFCCQLDLKGEPWGPVLLVEKGVSPGNLARQEE